MARRKIDPADGLAAVRAVSAGETSRPQIAMAVRFLLEELTELAPGGTVEVRVPPFGATQCIAGTRHTRGTPPNVIEMSAEVWISIATGARTWHEALQSGDISASGQRAEIAALLPIVRL